MNVLERVLPQKLAGLVTAQRLRLKRRSLIAGWVIFAAGMGLVGYMLFYSLSRSTGLRLNGELLAGLTIGLGLVCFGVTIVRGNWGEGFGNDPAMKALLMPGNPVVDAGVLHRGTRRALMVNLKQGDRFPLYRLPMPPDAALEEELVGSLLAMSRPPLHVVATPATASVPESNKLTAKNGARRIPDPSKLQVIDKELGRINISVLIFGAAASDFLRSCLESTGAALPETGAPPGQLEYARTELASVRGWASHLHLYAIDSSLEGTIGASRLATCTTSVILTQPGSGALDPALHAMANKTREGGALLLVVGSSETRAKLRDETGVVADHEADFDVTRAVDVLKILTKSVLGSLKG